MVNGAQRAVGLVTALLLALTCAWLVYDYGENSRISTPSGDSGVVMLGSVETLRLAPLAFPMEARIDTGADLSSLDARRIKEFKKGKETWVTFQVVERNSGRCVELSLPVIRFVWIKRHGLVDQCRPVVSLELMLGSQMATSLFTLTDRSKFLYPVLIGRSFLHGRAVVDVSRNYLAGEPSNAVPE